MNKNLSSCLWTVVVQCSVLHSTAQYTVLSMYITEKWHNNFELKPDKVSHCTIFIYYFFANA